MTATDELRALLDERGVEWGTGFGGDTFWTGRHGIEWRWDKQEGALAMFTHTITPEQAVEATLGRGECYDAAGEKMGFFSCSACGGTDKSKNPEFCHWCGRRVVEE